MTDNPQSEFTLVNIPGYGDSGLLHWQTLWEKENPSILRVQQLDWFNPVCEAWVAALERTVAAQAKPVVLMAHSLGCIAAVHWANTSPNAARCIAAFLVAPGDIERPEASDLGGSFAPIPLRRLPFESMVVASTNDPYISMDRARWFAMAWGSQLENLGALGHINADSAIGDWSDGKALLASLIQAGKTHQEL